MTSPQLDNYIGWYNVKQFGAPSDLYNALGKANAVCAGAGVIVIPPGAYVLSTNFSPSSGVCVLVSEGVTLTGAGALSAGSGALIDLRGGLRVSGVLYLDGMEITATAAELNIMDGVTATAAELNSLDGVTATTAELNTALGEYGKRAFGILRVAAAVEDGETVTIGADVYEFDTHDAATIGVGNIRVDVSGGSTVKSQGTLTVDTQPTPLTAAQGTLTLPDQVTAGDTMTIDAKVYTFQANGALTNVDGNIEIGVNLAATQANIVNAINLTGTPGTGYAASMTLHPTVSAGAFAANAAVLTAKTGGAAGNSIVTTETFTSLNNVFDAGTLGTTTAGAAADTMTIGAKVYTFQANGSLTNVDGNIEIGANLAGTQANIVAAINLSGTPGTGYAAAMTLHPTVSIAAFAANAAVLTAKAGGTAGNAIATTETFAAASNIFNAVTLGTTTAGVDPPAAEASDALIAAINASATEAASAIDIDANTVLLVADAVGAVVLGTTTDMGGAGNAWDAATMGSGLAATRVRVLRGARVPTAAEVTAGKILIPCDFDPATALIDIVVTATGVPVAWNGARTLTAAAGGLPAYVTLDNSGATDWSADHTIHYLITS